MKNSNLIKVLKSLSNDEFKGFGRFVDSPFHNRRTEVKRFFDLLKKYYPEFNEHSIKDEKIYSKLYPGKKYDDRVIRRLSSFLMRVVEDYLSYIRYSKDEYNVRKSLLEELGERGLAGLYNKTLTDMETKYNEFIPPSEKYFLRKYYIVEDKLNNFLYKVRDAGLVKDMEDHSLFLIELLLVFIFQAKYNLFLYEVEFRADFSSSVFNKLFEQIDFPDLIKYLKQRDKEFYPYISIYYYELMSLLEPDNEENTSNFMNLLEKNGSRFSWVEMRNFYYIFVSICTLKIEMGKQEYKQVLMNVYKKMLKLDLCSEYEGGHFSAKLFRNIVAAANIAEEFDWLENFIKENKNKLSLGEQSNIYHLSMALLNYEREEFEKTLDNIMKIDLDLVQFKIDVRYLMVKTYYELDLYEQLLSSIDAFRHFLSSDKHISDRVVSVYTNFCNLIGRLAKIRLNNSIENLPAVKQEIEELENKATSEWLMRKAQEIE
ncbi:MAG: hypothetical protein KDC73_03345 [Ignavibacteriae bacterium]|nr:hypothetical protein [Ignavibacteriota bacterium]MCB9244244.1 hypothetical protein [Ignavibacteriales bacterium]